MASLKSPRQQEPSRARKTPSQSISDRGGALISISFSSPLRSNRVWLVRILFRLLSLQLKCNLPGPPVPHSNVAAISLWWYLCRDEYHGYLVHYSNGQPSQEHKGCEYQWQHARPVLDKKLYAFQKALPIRCCTRGHLFQAQIGRLPRSREAIRVG